MKILPHIIYRIPDISNMHNFNAILAVFFL